jgi:hypothetical protein
MFARAGKQKKKPPKSGTTPYPNGASASAPRAGRNGRGIAQQHETQVTAQEQTESDTRAQTRADASPQAQRRSPQAQLDMMFTRDEQEGAKCQERCACADSRFINFQGRLAPVLISSESFATFRNCSFQNFNLTREVFDVSFGGMLRLEACSFNGVSGTDSRKLVSTTSDDYILCSGEVVDQSVDITDAPEASFFNYATDDYAYDVFPAQNSTDGVGASFSVQNATMSDCLRVHYTCAPPFSSSHPPSPAPPPSSPPLLLLFSFFLPSPPFLFLLFRMLMPSTRPPHTKKTCLDAPFHATHFFADQGGLQCFVPPRFCLHLPVACLYFRPDGHLARALTDDMIILLQYTCS